MEFSNDQKKYIDNVQKSITKVCIKRCFNQQGLQTPQKCQDVCYNKYMRTLGQVNEEQKECAHDVVSQYALKIWPFAPLRSKFYYEDELYPVFDRRNDFYFNEIDLTNRWISKESYQGTAQDDLS